MPRETGSGYNGVGGGRLDATYCGGFTSKTTKRGLWFVVCVVVQALQSSFMAIELYDSSRSHPLIYGNLDSYERKKQAQGADFPLFLATSYEYPTGGSANSKMLRTQKYD